MARALMGDTSLALHHYDLVADQLEVTLVFMPWTAAGDPPSLDRPVESVVDRVRARLTA